MISLIAGDCFTGPTVNSTDLYNIGVAQLHQFFGCLLTPITAAAVYQNQLIFIRHLNVYIYAPMDARLRNAVELAKLDEKTAKKMIREIDRSRELYHRRYCPEYVDPSTNKDIMIDSSRFGAEGTVKILAGLVRELFG